MVHIHFLEYTMQFLQREDIYGSVRRKGNEQNENKRKKKGWRGGAAGRDRNRPPSIFLN